jgi:hypothetical protein
MEQDKQPSLFEQEHLRPVEVVELTLDGPPLRAVYWQLDNERVCLVRCDAGERNVVKIRALSTLCGISCKEIVRTSAIPPAKMPYCQACVAGAGHGVLR